MVLKKKRNGVETIVDSDGIFWLNEKHKEEGLDHKNLQVNAIIYFQEHSRELVNECQPKILFISKELATKGIMHRL